MRLPYTPESEVDNARRPLYDAFLDDVGSNFSDIVHKRSDGALVGPWGVWMQRPDVGRPMLELIDAIRTIPGLSPAARQVVILTTGAHFDAAYEIYAHTAAAKKAGLSDEQISVLLAGHRPADLTGDLGLAADVTTALLRGGVLAEPLYSRALRELGQDALDAIVFSTAQYCFVSVMLNAYDVPSEATITGAR